MTAVMDHAALEHGNWKAHAHVDIYRAVDEREAMHELFPARARLVDLSKRKGYKLPRLLVPHIEKAMLDRLGADPIGERDEVGNLLVNAGINRMGSLLIGGGGQVYDNGHTAIGVGDTNTAATAGDTDLAAAINAANRYVQDADTSYPTFASQVLTVLATFATGNANFAWAEWAIGQNTSAGASAITAAMLNRKVASLGTKTSAAAWAFTVTVTIS